MRVAITGHTAGLGKHLYDHFCKKELTVGMSRSNGYNIVDDRTKIVETIKDFDLFINCAHSNDAQESLLLDSINNVKNIVVIGTAMQAFDNFLPLGYIQQKRNLSNRCRLLNIDPNVRTNILLINISFLPRTPGSLVKTDNNIEYQDVIDIIEYWLAHKNISEVTFTWKLTDLVLSEFKNVFSNIDFNLFIGNKND